MSVFIRRHFTFACAPWSACLTRRVEIWCLRSESVLDENADSLLLKPFRDPFLVEIQKGIPINRCVSLTNPLWRFPKSRSANKRIGSSNREIPLNRHRDSFLGDILCPYPAFLVLRSSVVFDWSDWKFSAPKVCQLLETDSNRTELQLT